MHGILTCSECDGLASLFSHKTSSWKNPVLPNSGVCHFVFCNGVVFGGPAFATIVCEIVIDTNSFGGFMKMSGLNFVLNLLVAASGSCKGATHFLSYC